MTWKDTVDAHPFWQTIGIAHDLLDEEGWPNDAELRDAIARTRYVLDQVERRKDPASITSDSLANGNNAATNLRNALANAKANPSAHIGQIHQFLDQLLNFIGPWPAPDRLNLTQGIRDANAQVQMAAESVISDLKQQLENERSQAKQNLDAWRASADEQLATLGG